jgi:hypothetical protein
MKHKNIAKISLQLLVLLVAGDLLSFNDEILLSGDLPKWYFYILTCYNLVRE